MARVGRDKWGREFKPSDEALKLQEDQAKLDQLIEAQTLVQKSGKRGPYAFQQDFGIDTGRVNTIEDLIGQVEPVARGLIEQGGERATTELERGRQRSTELLKLIAGSGVKALEEESAILGNLGPEAQRAAIDRITATPLEAEQMRRQTQQTRAQQSARGGVGGGNTIAQLLGLEQQQQSGLVSRKLTDLQGVSSKGLGALSDILRLTEDFGMESAFIPMQTSTSLANIIQGTSAPIAESRQSSAEASSLRSLAGSQAQQQQVGMLTNMAGQLSQSYFQPQQQPAYVNPSYGYDSAGYSGGGGTQISYGGGSPIGVA